MIEIRLREALERYHRRTGMRLTYHQLAARTGLARSTLESMASRPGYNASLASIDRLCEALDCEVSELLARQRIVRSGNE
jgi:putative transcriptional regulator